MQTFLTEALPNLMKRLPEFWKAVGDTILMEVWAGSICFVVGLFLGVVLTVTRPGGILERPVLYHVLDKLVNSRTSSTLTAPSSRPASSRIGRAVRL